MNTPAVQGGSHSIVPVQGGGGSTPPPGFNWQASLLNTGGAQTAAITPLAGGGTLTDPTVLVAKTTEEKKQAAVDAAIDGAGNILGSLSNNPDLQAQATAAAVAAAGIAQEDEEEGLVEGQAGGASAAAAAAAAQAAAAVAAQAGPAAVAAAPEVDAATMLPGGLLQRFLGAVPLGSVDAQATAAAQIAAGAAKENGATDAEAEEAARAAADDVLTKYEAQAAQSSSITLTPEANRLLNSADGEAKKRAEIAANIAAKAAQDNGATDEEAVRAGAAAAYSVLKQAEETKETQERLASRRASVVSKPAPATAAEASNPIHVEFYKIGTLNPYYFNLIQRRRREIAEKPQLLHTMLDGYERRKQQKWPADALTKNERKRGTHYPTKDNEVYDTLVAFLPSDTQTLCVVPPVNGDETLFLQSIEQLQTMGILIVDEKRDTFTIRPGAVVVWMAPFYTSLVVEGLPSTDENTINMANKNLFLMYLYISIEKDNLDQCFTLSERTPLYHGIGTTINAYRMTKREPFVLPLLEPAYIAMTLPDNKKLVLSSSATAPFLPVKSVRVPTNTDVLYDAIAPSRAEYTEEKIIFYSQSGAVQKHLNVELGEDATKDPGCESLLSVKPLSELSQQPIRVATHEQMKDVLLAIRLSGDRIPLCKHAKDAELPSLGRFKESNLLTAIKGVQTRELEFGSKLFRIRFPLDTSGVQMDWEGGHYTESEADLLNSLMLRPRMMNDIFPPNASGPTWKHEVAKFFNELVVKECLTESELLTRSECNRARQFLQQIFDYLAQQNLMNLEETERDTYIRDLEDYVKRDQSYVTDTIKEDSIVERLKEEPQFVNQILFDDEKTPPLAYVDVTAINKKTQKFVHLRLNIPVNEKDEPKSETYIKTVSEKFRKKLTELKQQHPGYVFFHLLG